MLLLDGGQLADEGVVGGVGDLGVVQLVVADVVVLDLGSELLGPADRVLGLGRAHAFLVVRRAGALRAGVLRAGVLAAALAAGVARSTALGTGRAEPTRAVMAASTVARLASRAASTSAAGADSWRMAR